MAGNPPTLPPVGSTDGGFNPSFDTPTANGDAHPESSAASPVEAPPAPQPLEKAQDASDPQTQQKVQGVLYSDIGVNTLLNRLKASIASARVRFFGPYPYAHLYPEQRC